MAKLLELEIGIKRVHPFFHYEFTNSSQPNIATQKIYFRRFSVTSDRNIENLRQEHIEYNKEVQQRVPKIVIDQCPHASHTEKSEISSDIIVQDIEDIERNL